MNKLELTYSPYTMKLISPFETSKGKITERKGFIITLKSPTGKSGIGDAAPFPEFGSESFEEAEEVLSKIEIKLNIDIDDVKNSMKFTLKNFELFPALRHGLEQALLNLICKETKTTLTKFLGLKLRKEIRVNAAIGILTVEDAVIKAKDFVSKGFKTLKIKAGRENFEDDFKVISAVKESVGAEIKIRIDINGKWDTASAEKNLMHLENLNIEYAEQPVNSIDEFCKLKKVTGIPIAADESIRNVVSAKNFIANKAVDAIVLKPMLTGGLIPALEIIELAEKNHIIPVITSSFESAIGKTNAVIAAACVNSDVAHGLSVSDYFAEDIAYDKYPVIDGKITVH